MAAEVNQKLSSEPLVNHRIGLMEPSPSHLIFPFGESVNSEYIIKANGMDGSGREAISTLDHL